MRQMRRSSWMPVYGRPWLSKKSTTGLPRGVRSFAPAQQLARDVRQQLFGDFARAVAAERPPHPGRRGRRIGQEQRHDRARRQPPHALDAAPARRQRGQHRVDGHTQRASSWLPLLVAAQVRVQAQRMQSSPAEARRRRCCTPLVENGANSAISASAPLSSGGAGSATGAAGHAGPRIRRAEQPGKLPIPKIDAITLRECRPSQLAGSRGMPERPARTLGPLRPRAPSP
jgi:hypothetical protein